VCSGGCGGIGGAEVYVERVTDFGVACGRTGGRGSFLFADGRSALAMEMEYIERDVDGLELKNHTTSKI